MLRRAARTGGVALLGLFLALPLCAQEVATTHPDATRSGIYPQFSWRGDGPAVAAGAAMVVGSFALHTDLQDVPPGGLDPSTINLALDRDQVGHNDTNANRASDWWRNATVVYPIAVMYAAAPSGERMHTIGLHGLMYGEAILLAEGLTGVLKVAIARPRPFTYLPESEIPDHAKYDVDQARAFQSMPSGHAATTWCASSFAITDHLLQRPDAGWVERSAVGFVGGVMATTTSALRVEAGQHFPTDVIVGGLIGTASGVGTPLAHRWLRGGNRAPLPSGHAWLQALGGTVAGIGAGLLVTTAFEH